MSVLPWTMPDGSYPFRIAGWGAVPANSSLSFNYSPYGPPPSWNFPVTVFAGTQFWVSDIQFQSKNVRTPTNAWIHRSSYAIYQSLFTMTEHNPSVSYRSPIILPAGFLITGTFQNSSDEMQHMITAIHGYVVPIST